ncbi:hypothetical protein NJC40_15375 [Pseudomonas sp. 21LCFQ02]|uniref:hypothetical protein n=1 Tax=Pseudomonas sp. 21LCFQ02 TaxID=2957505 RepID=UPI00209B1482|nr:hypothetical protein [Pseudomonas sp. 21LCFQ02]MCO8169152.1 hypothetical protein [Pseudomonas sp. 21LCFQ02]
MTTDSCGSIGVIDVLETRVTGREKSIQCKDRSYYCVSVINKNNSSSGASPWNMSFKTLDLS